MTNLTYAIIASANGIPIVSNKGIRYNPEQLNAKALGEHAAVFDSGVISAGERKGEWQILIPRKSIGAMRKRAVHHALKRKE